MQRCVLGFFLWLGFTTNLVANPPKTKRAIFVVPGAFVAPESYEPLVKKVVDKLDNDISVAFARYVGGFPLSSSTNQQLEAFHRSLMEQGYEPEITVMGHSQGGLALANLPRGLYSRVVLMSSYIQSDWLQKGTFHWDKPVLALSGTLDRLTHPERVAYDSYIFNDEWPFKAVLLDRVNHSQFANGKIKNADLDSPLSIEQALNEISKFISAFIEDDLSQLRDDPSFQLSNQLLLGYRQALNRDRLACQNAQLAHLGITEDPAIEIDSTRYTGQQKYPQFIIDKSFLKKEGDKTIIGIYQFEENRLAPIDLAPIRSVTPEVIACKLRSAEAVSKSVERTFNGRTCAEENASILKESFATLPEVRKERLRQKGMDFDSSHMESIDQDQQQTIRGPGFEVVNTYRERGDQWALGSFFKSSQGSEGITVQTFSVQTPLGSPNNPFFGAYYCKLIAPSRAYQLLESMSR